MNVVLYSRVSSQGNRQSTQRQVAELERFAISRGYTVIGSFEEHISGKKGSSEPHRSRNNVYIQNIYVETLLPDGKIFSPYGKL